MFLTFLIFSLICAFNIFRRLSCKLNTKITKFTIISNLVFSVICFGSVYIFKDKFNYNNLTLFCLTLMICLSFFTSLTSSGISKYGFVHPWNLISKTYKWENIKEISVEKKENSIMLSFNTIITQYRQEYNLKDAKELKHLIKEYKKINLKNI